MKNIQEQFMKKTLFWGDDMDFAYGYVRDFQDEQEFIQAVKFQFKEYEEESLIPRQNYYIHVDVKKELCFVTEKGLQPESITPVHLADVTMEEFYVAKVELKENNAE